MYRRVRVVVNESGAAPRIAAGTEKARRPSGRRAWLFTV